MGRIFFGLAALFFFLAAVGATVLPNAAAWGLVAVALGLVVGNWLPWKRTP